MPKTKKKVTVALTDIDRVCRICGRVSDSVMTRSYYTKSYMGPCADSFCYSSCNMSTCRPISVKACEKCEQAKRDLP